jgi:hypothetical protein
MWLHILGTWNGKSRWLRGEEVVLTHDASKSGFGFFLEHVPPWFDQTSLPPALQTPHGFAGAFSAQELQGPVQRSIQYAELFAIAASVALYGPFLANCKCSLLLRSDNAADVHIINRQSTKAPDLLPLLRAIYATCAKYNISIRASHVPGVENDIADFLSRPSLHQFCCVVPPHMTHSSSPIRILFVASSSLTLPARPPATFNFAPSSARR